MMTKPPPYEFSTKQKVLQSFIVNNLVAPRDMEFAKAIAYRANPSSKQTLWVDKLISRVLKAAEAQEAAPVQTTLNGDLSDLLSDGMT